MNLVLQIICIVLVFHSVKAAIEGYTPKMNTECSGNDIGSPFIATVYTCIYYCGEGPCVAVVYDPTNALCLLKSLCENFTPRYGYDVYYKDIVPDYTLKPNVNCAGNDIYGKIPATLDECIAACADGPCVAVLYYATNQECRAKSLCDNFIPLNGGNVYHKDAVFVPGYKETPNSDCAGNDILWEFQATLDECIAECTDLCVAVLYNPAISKCWTKSLCNNFTPLNGYNVYHKDNVPGYTLIPNSDCSGNAMSWEFPITLDECIAECDGSCVGVLYSRFNGYCYTKWLCDNFSSLYGYDLHLKD